MQPISLPLIFHLHLQLSPSLSLLLAHCKLRALPWRSPPIMRNHLHRLLPSTQTTENFIHTSAHLHRHSTTYHHLNHAVRECALQGDLRKAMAIHCLLTKHATIGGFISVWNGLLLAYLRLSGFDLAHHLFDEMPERDVVTYNTLISASVRRRDTDRALTLYDRMRKDDIHPNHITLARLICAVRNPELIHAHVIHYGLQSDEFVGSSLIDKYAKNSLLIDATKAFNEIAAPDLISYNVLLDGIAKSNSKDNALRFFSQMLKEFSTFDGFTFTSVIKTCLKPSALFTGMCLHGVAIKSCLALETPVSNALITMYSKCEKSMSLAMEVFRNVAEPNTITWTAVISGLMQNKLQLNAAVIYKQMLESGVKDNHFVFATILPIFGNQVHARIAKSPFNDDTSVNNALIDTYSKSGCLTDAYLVFSRMDAHDVVSYTTMITALGQHGKGSEALMMLAAMADEGLIPDDVTFLGCLNACSHSGMVDEGIEVFKRMVGVYEVRPRKEHCACVVDMLGRAGRLIEAETFVEEMGLGSDVAMWETLLGACLIHGETGLGEKAGKRVMELRPGRHGSLALLANIYAERDMWEEKGATREGSSGDGAQTGFSWVV